MSDTQQDPQAEIAARDEEIAKLQAELEAAHAATTTSRETAAPPAEVPDAAHIGVPASASSAAASPAEGGQETATHAIGPGSSGPAVAELAAKVEQAGEKTYLSDPNAQNPGDVFTDDLLEAVKRVLFAHPSIATADGAEGARVKRWISNLEVVSAEVWRLIDDVISHKAAA